MERTNFGESIEEAQLHLIEAIKKMTMTSEEFIRTLNEVLEVLKRNEDE